MAKGKNKAKARAAAQVLAAERVGPTRQTAAKVKPCPIRRMHGVGQIDDDQRDAALEIALVHEAISGRLRAAGLRLAQGVAPFRQLIASHLTQRVA